jgi:hypothetical protein
MIAMDGEHQEHPSRVGEGRWKRPQKRVEDLKVAMIVEEAEPGSALDDQLRQEQTRAIFDLLKAARVSGGQQ